MQISRIAAVAALGMIAVGSYAPADAAPKPKPKPKPITKSYSMQLAPVPDPLPSGSSCMRPQLEGVSVHTETIKPTGPGILSIKVNGFGGDWDITVMDGQRNEVAVGDGTSTGGGAPAAAGEDTLVVKYKKGETILIAMCNFAGTPSAKGTFTYTYK